jgi:hypothetical protein
MRRGVNSGSSIRTANQQHSVLRTCQLQLSNIGSWLLLFLMTVANNHKFNNTFWFCCRRSVQGAALWDLSTPAMLTVSELPSWLPLPLQQLFWPFEAQKAAEQHLSTETFPEADGSSGSCRKARRRERRAARQQRRAYRRMQKQLQKASKAAAGGAAGTAASSSTIFELASTTPSTGPYSSSRAVGDAAELVAATSSSGSSGGMGTQMLAHMINPANTFPMLLHSAQHLQQQQQQTETASTAEQTLSADAEQQQCGESSSSGVLGRRRPQQLLTVGCRHWGNGMVQGLGLKVKIYDFAIYLDGQQVRGSN